MARKKKPSPENIPGDIADSLAETGEALADGLADALGFQITPPKPKRDYKVAYKRRVARAKQRGFTSPYQETRYHKRVREAKEQGRKPEPVADFTKAATLAKWRITEEQFNRIRKLNRAHLAEGSARAAEIQRYRLSIDRRTKDFSDARVGYVVSFYNAVVDESKNFYSISPRMRYLYDGSAKLKAWQNRQALYLIKYSGITSIDEFDARYGDGSYVGSIGEGERK